MQTKTYDKKDESKDGDMYSYKTEYELDKEAHDYYITDFDAYEAMLSGKVYDSVSKTVNKSAITDSYSATLSIERAARVVGKLPDGKVEAAAKKDTGKATLMDIIRQKWIYPNANSQHYLATKIRMWQLYSSVYGYMPMFYDWNVSPTGYVGPDCWLWNPRNLIPQRGRTSITDMDYVHAISYVGEEYLKAKLDDEEGGWDSSVVQELLDLAEKNNSTKISDDKRKTKVQKDRESFETDQGIMLVTRYEAGDDGKWVTFAPDHGCRVVREIKNPHKNGRIPFVIKYSLPLFDSFYGIGDFQRAKPLQFARDGLTNFYFKAIKVNLIPPVIANANGVLKHTLTFGENNVMFETIPNSIRRMETSTAGLNTYQAAQSQLTGSLLSLYGTSNASIPGAEALDPSQGKTPAAINLYGNKEATRDGQERTFLEQALEELHDGWFSLIANIGTEQISINLFAEEVQELIDQGYEDILDLVDINESGQTGSLRIKPGKLKGAEYRFNISPNSTAKITKEEEVAELDRLVERLSKFNNQLQQDTSVSINWASILQAYQKRTGIREAQDFITVKSPEQMEAEQQAAAEQQALAQAQAQPAMAPATANIGGMAFRDPDAAALAEAIANN